MSGRIIDKLMACKLGLKYFYFIPEILALCVTAPLVYMAVDRTPPLVLYDGIISPAIVRPGQHVEVKWRAKFSGRDCDGLSQREIVDSAANLWPKVARPRKGSFVPDKDNPFEGTVRTPELDIPTQIEPGDAYYRVTQFYYCNPLQRWLDSPIVKKSPPIRFYVVQ